MTRFARRRDRLDDLLRRHRPTARPDFVSGLAAHVARRPERTGRRAGFRLGLALVATLSMLGAFGAVGGIGYAASAAKTVAKAVTPVAQAVKAAPAPPPPAPQLAAAAKSSDKKSDGGDNKGDKGGKKGGDDEDDDDDNPSHDQYKPGKGCGDDNHVHAKENECKDKKPKKEK
jgi:hypothetical protein